MLVPSESLVQAPAAMPELGESVAWVGVAVWGGALLAMMTVSAAHWYRRHASRDHHLPGGWHRWTSHR